MTRAPSMDARVQTKSMRWMLMERTLPGLVMLSSARGSVDSKGRMVCEMRGMRDQPSFKSAMRSFMGLCIIVLGLLSSLLVVCDGENVTVMVRCCTGLDGMRSATDKRSDGTARVAVVARDGSGCRGFVASDRRESTTNTLSHAAYFRQLIEIFLSFREDYNETH
jgi:hypothetical protein